MKTISALPQLSQRESDAPSTMENTYAPTHTPDILRDSVKKTLQQYFAHLDGQESIDLYQMVMNEIEPPLLDAVMNYVQGNQTRAASMLGLNRGTLRKKLKQYALL